MIKQYKFKNKTYYLIQLSITEPSGQRHQPRFRFNKNNERITSEKNAKALEFEYHKDFENQLQGKITSMTFAQWQQRFLESIKLSHKRGTVMQYDGDLKKWLPSNFVSKKLTEITRADVHHLIFNYLPSEGATANLQKKTRRVLSKILESAMDEGLISRNPCKGISVKVPPSVKQVLNVNEVEAFLDAAKSTNHRFYHIWSVALFSGLRNGELYSLRWKDIDTVTGNITLSTQWTNKDGLHATKSNKSRIVPISHELQELFTELKSIGPFKEELKGLDGSSHYVDDLVLPRSSEWRHGEQAKITQRFCAQIGVTEICFHDLRATFITNLLAQGVSLPKVMAIVGHSRTSTTDEYLRLAGVNVKGTTNQLGYKIPRMNFDNITHLFPQKSV